MPFVRFVRFARFARFARFVRFVRFNWFDRFGCGYSGFGFWRLLIALAFCFACSLRRYLMNGAFAAVRRRTSKCAAA